jgi:putative ABC transport system substrate-binding protein
MKAVSRMRRRQVIRRLAVVLPWAALSLQARAQQRAHRVVWVSMEQAHPDSPFLNAFRHGLRSRGWVEGRTLNVEPQWAEGSAERLRRTIIPQILASPPDVVVGTTVAVRPLVDANLPMPLVFAFSGDPVLAGIVQSWARPGVNRTGVSYFSLELVAKRLELLRELLPGLRRVAIVGWPPHAGEQLELQATQAAADRFGLAHQYHGASTAAEVDAALEAARAWRADAVFVFAGVVANAFADRFALFGERHRLPSVSAWAAFAEAGNLMSYGPILAEGQSRMAAIVDRLLRGEKAADVPVEGPTRFELVLNLKAARTLRVEVPRPFLQRADRVIE